jgi:protein TonB
MAMPLDLFRPTRGYPRPHRATPLVAWPLSIGAHVAVLAAVLVIPLMAADVLPSPREIVDWVQATPVPEPPAAPVPVRRAAAVTQAVADQRLAPVDAPSAVGRESGIAIPADAGLADAVRGGATVPGGVENGVPAAFDRPPEPPPPAAPVPVGGRIQRPAKISDALPDYPDIARRARVEGIVIIQAIIGKTGLVEEATVLRSIPLLDAAALAAVRQWRFTPTLLNGQPISVIMTVTVQFMLESPKR